jgi:hypothetical protein
LWYPGPHTLMRSSRTHLSSFLSDFIWRRGRFWMIMLQHKGVILCSTEGGGIYIVSVDRRWRGCTHPCWHKSELRRILWKYDRRADTGLAIEKHESWRWLSVYFDRWKFCQRQTRFSLRFIEVKNTEHGGWSISLERGIVNQMDSTTMRP